MTEARWYDVYDADITLHGEVEITEANCSNVIVFEGRTARYSSRHDAYVLDPEVA